MMKRGFRNSAAWRKQKQGCLYGGVAVCLSLMGLLIAVPPARAEDIPPPTFLVPSTAENGGQLAAKYTVYSHWLPVMTVKTDFRLTPHTYDVDLLAHAEGLFSLFTRLNVESVVHGTLSGSNVMPARYDSSGWSRHAQRHVIVDYTQTVPMLVLQDPPETDREKVPENMLHGTADILSTMTKLLVQIGETGKCDGTFNIFDGMRLTRFIMHNDGVEMREDVSHSKKVPTLRCGFIGYQVAGFIIGHKAKTLREPHSGMLWFENVDGFGPVPVRAVMEHPNVGKLTVDLDEVKLIQK